LASVSAIRGAGTIHLGINLSVMDGLKRTIASLNTEAEYGWRSAVIANKQTKEFDECTVL